MLNTSASMHDDLGRGAMTTTTSNTQALQRKVALIRVEMLACDACHDSADSHFSALDE